MRTPTPNKEPAWLTLARGEIGVTEAPGPKNSPTVLRYYRDAHHPEIEHDSVAWCAAFACAMLERCDFPSPRQLTARSFLTWGKKLDGPRVGAIAVMKRGRKAWEGHVFIVTEWGDDWVRGIGGNQGDAVSEQRFPASAMLGYRWPVTLQNSRTAASAAATATSGATAATAQAVQNFIPPPETLLGMAEAGNGFAGALGALGSILPVIGITASVLTVIFAAVTFYARVDDLRNKGR